MSNNTVLSASMQRESLDFTNWPIFSCDGIFEPPLISSQAPLTHEKLGYLQSTVSFPGMASPENRVKPVGVAIGKMFVSAVRKLFEQQAHTTTPVPLDVKRMRDAIHDTPACDDFTREMLEKWLTVNQETITAIVSNNPNTVILAYLVLDLLSFYNGTLPQATTNQQPKKQQNSRRT